MPLGYEKCLEASGTKEEVVADWARTPEVAAERARRAERATVDILQDGSVGRTAVEGRDREGQGREGWRRRKSRCQHKVEPIGLNMPVPRSHSANSRPTAFPTLADARTTPTCPRHPAGDPALDSVDDVQLERLMEEDALEVTYKYSNITHSSKNMQRPPSSSPPLPQHAPTRAQRPLLQRTVLPRIMFYS